MNQNNIDLYTHIPTKKKSNDIGLDHKIKSTDKQNKIITTTQQRMHANHQNTKSNGASQAGTHEQISISVGFS